MPITLLEVFKDFDVTIKGYGQFGKYRQLFKLIPKPNAKPVTLQDLENYVKNLQQKYPDKNFNLLKKTINGKTYYIINKKKRIQSKKQIYDRVPIWFDLENQKIYVPKSYVTRQKRLTNYILMRTLGTLGLAKQIYVSTISKRQ